MNINQTVTAGNVVTQPVLEHVGAGGISKCTFRFAHTPRRRDADGNWQDGSTVFIDVTCWRSLAENVYMSANKGDGLVIVGSLAFDEWEKDGQRRSKHEIEADAVGIDLSRHPALVKRARRSTPDTAAPSDGRTFGDGSDGGVELASEFAELDELEAGVGASV